MDCRPVLDVRHRGQIARRVEVLPEPVAFCPPLPTIRRVRHELPAKSQVVRELLRDARLPVPRHAVAVAGDVARAEVAQRHADQARVVAPGKRNDDGSAGDALEKALEHATVEPIEPVDQRRRVLREEFTVPKRVVARDLSAVWHRRGRTNPRPGLELPDSGTQRLRARHVAGQAELHVRIGIDRERGPLGGNPVRVVAEENASSPLAIEQRNGTDAVHCRQHAPLVLGDDRETAVQPHDQASPRLVARCRHRRRQRCDPPAGSAHRGVHSRALACSPIAPRACRSVRCASRARWRSCLYEGLRVGLACTRVDREEVTANLRPRVASRGLQT